MSGCLSATAEGTPCMSSWAVTVTMSVSAWCSEIGSQWHRSIFHLCLNLTLKYNETIVFLKLLRFFICIFIFWNRKQISSLPYYLTVRSLRGHIFHVQKIMLTLVLLIFIVRKNTLQCIIIVMLLSHPTLSVCACDIMNHKIFVFLNLKCHIVSCMLGLINLPWLLSIFFAAFQSRFFSVIYVLTS